MARNDKRKQLEVIGDPNDSQSLYYYLMRFLQHSQVLNVSKRTLEIREVFNRRFIYWCDDRGLLRPADITKPILERYQRHLYLKRKTNGQPLSISSQLNYLASVKALFKWLAKNNHILYNPASDLDLPKVGKRLPKNILKAHEVDEILNKIDISCDAGIRDRAIIEMLYSTGIRRKELSDLKLHDIDIEGGTLMVRHGKGDKDRMVPIGKRAISWLEKYLNDVRPQYVIGDSGNSLFLNNYGQGIGVTWLSRIVTAYIKKIGKKGSCHLFRHTMASLMLENGADIRYIQLILGHADLRTTQIYTQVSIQKLKDIHEATHPAKNKLSNQTPSKPETKP